MKLPLSRATLASAAALAAVLVPVGAASAESLTVNDQVGDTWLDDYSGDVETYTPSGSWTNDDLVRTVVRHGDRRVVVKAKYADLKRSADPLILVVRLRTNESLKRDVAVETVSSPRGSVMFAKHSGADVKCTGLTHDVDYDADRVTVSVPRSCLSNPRWVQATVGAVAMTDEYHVHVDNGHNTGHHEPNTWTARIRRG